MPFNKLSEAPFDTLRVTGQKAMVGKPFVLS
jgi:hypothetical protein